MKRIACFPALWLLMCGCADRANEHISTVQVCSEGIYVETYKIFGGGAYGGDKVCDYLTDSTNFKIYIGTYIDDDETYSYKCNGNDIIIYRVAGLSENKNKIISTKTYHISTLRKSKNM